MSLAELTARFGGVPDDRAITDAVALGVLEPSPATTTASSYPTPKNWRSQWSCRRPWLLSPQ